MIVCSCNVISSSEIETAVEGLVAVDPDVVLTPGMVYRAFDCRPKCGTCLGHMAELMHAHRKALRAPSEEPKSVDKVQKSV